MVLETAVNGAADRLVSFNVRHLAGAAREFGICALRPCDAWREIRVSRLRSLSPEPPQNLQNSPKLQNYLPPTKITWVGVGYGPKYAAKFAGPGGTSAGTPKFNCTTPAISPGA